MVSPGPGSPGALVWSSRGVAMPDPTQHARGDGHESPARGRWLPAVRGRTAVGGRGLVELPVRHRGGVVIRSSAETAAGLNLATVISVWTPCPGSRTSKSRRAARWSPRNLLRPARSCNRQMRSCSASPSTPKGCLPSSATCWSGQSPVGSSPESGGVDQRRRMRHPGARRLRCPGTHTQIRRRRHPAPFRCARWPPRRCPPPVVHRSRRSRRSATTGFTTAR
jgi:hypothetical protein